MLPFNRKNPHFPIKPFMYGPSSWWPVKVIMVVHFSSEIVGFWDHCTELIFLLKEFLKSLIETLVITSAIPYCVLKLTNSTFLDFFSFSILLVLLQPLKQINNWKLKLLLYASEKMINDRIKIADISYDHRNQP